MKSKSLGLLAFFVLILTGCGGGGSNSQTQSKAPIPTNTSPIATNDSISVNLATEISIDVLANDSDIDGDSLTISSATADNGGTVTIENGALLYISADNFLGTETIRYEINDGNGGTASATVEVVVNVTITLLGKVTDEPIANAAVVATIGKNSVEVQADASGNYELSITSNNWNDFITLNATGKESQKNVEFVSQLGDLQSVYNAKGDDDFVDRSELHRLNVTNLTTASYALMTRNNGNEPATSQTELEALEANVDAIAVLKLAAVIKSIVDTQDGTLPEKFDTVLDFALNEEEANDITDNFSDEKLQALLAIMASDPELVAPVSAENIPDNLYLTWSEHRYSSYNDTADAGWEFQFNDDHSGIMYTQKEEPLNKLTFNWAINDVGNITITLNSPGTQSLSFSTYSAGDRKLIDGIQELNQLTLTRFLSSSTVDSYIVTATYSATYDEEKYNRSDDTIQYMAVAQKGNATLSFSAEELTSGLATFALPVIFHDPDNSIFSDILVFHDDGSLNSVDSSSWSINNGLLVLSLADGRSIEYQKMFIEDEGVTNVQITIYDNDHNIVRTFADLMITQQSDFALSTQDLTDNYWHYIDEGEDTYLMRYHGLLDKHYYYNQSFVGYDDQNNRINNYETYFYHQNFNTPLDSGLIEPLAFWFYENGVGIEGKVVDDQGTFEQNELNFGYYNEWVLNDEGTRITMKEGWGFPLDSWGGYEIKPIRRNGNKLYVLLTYLTGSDEEVAQKNVSFFTLVPRNPVMNVNTNVENVPSNLLTIKQKSIVNMHL